MPVEPRRTLLWQQTTCPEGRKTRPIYSGARGADDCPITIASMDKVGGGRRSHYQTIQTGIAEASAEDEIILALGASVGGHPNHRIGDRYADLHEMGRDADNPAGI